MSVNVSTSEDSATLSCELPCFTPYVQCELDNVTRNGMSVNVPVTVENITDSFISYEYPHQSIILTGLDKNTTYSYCVKAITIIMTTKELIGNPVCSDFTTKNDRKYICVYVAIHM